MKGYVTHPNKSKASTQPMFTIVIERLRIDHFSILNEQDIKPGPSEPIGLSYSFLTPASLNTTPPRRTVSNVIDTSPPRITVSNVTMNTTAPPTSPVLHIASVSSSSTSDINETDVTGESNISNRNSKDNFSDKVRDNSYKEATEWIHKRTDGIVRNEKLTPCCTMCDRNILTQSKWQAGHITSVSEGGKALLKNCIAICKKCNSNETRNCAQIMVEEYGQNHPNTINFIEFCKHFKKDLGENYKYLLT
jgi:5-methylcytosine-specific restriction endonuclease McrA